MATAVIMPRQGQSVESCVIGKWHKQKGDKVSIGDILFTYETDKAAFEEAAKAEGILLEIFYEEGDDVECLKTVCVIGAEGESIKEFTPHTAPSTTDSKTTQDNSGSPESTNKDSKPQIDTSEPIINNSEFRIPNSEFPPVSPRARALAERTGADISFAIPTGANNRVMESDIRAVIAKGHFATRAAGEERSNATGTGIGGRVTTYDVQSGKSGTPPSFPPGSAAAGNMFIAALHEPDCEDIKLTNVRKIIAKSMHASLSNSAQLTLHSSFDATDIFSFRAAVQGQPPNVAQPASMHGHCGENPEHGSKPVCRTPADPHFSAAPEQQRFRKNPETMAQLKGTAKITVTDIIIFAVSRVILDHKSINAHFLGDKTVRYNNAHIGVAVDTPRGLLVPTIRGANSLSLAELSAQAKVLFEKCRQGVIEPDSLKGASFTISNLGGLGIEMFTPILNPPQTGLLGVCCTVERTKEGKAYPAMGLSLTFDHRALDGADAARFLKSLVQYLEKFSINLAHEGGL